MLRVSHEENVMTRIDSMRYIGQRFRIKVDMPPWSTDEAICHQLLKYI